MDDKSKGRHSISIQERNRVAIVGIVDVFSFDEMQVDVETGEGMLLIQGENLHITRLSLDKGDLELEGLIHSIAYHDNYIGKPGGSFLGKLFK